MAMSAPAPSHQSHHHFTAAQHEVFQAALETVRALPGWEVLTAHPETGEIRARSRGRLFSPTMDHVVRLRPATEGTDVELESTNSRSAPGRVDAKTADMFRVLLEDRLARHPPREPTH